MFIIKNRILKQNQTEDYIKISFPGLNLCKIETNFLNNNINRRNHAFLLILIFHSDEH